MSRKQPLDFRQAEVSYVMQRWRGAESCSLVGIGSVGKSNLIQHLADPDVQAQYIDGLEPGQFKAIVIDPNMLGALPNGGGDNEQFRCWAGYELMMHRLFLAFYPFEVLGTDDARRFYDAYQALQDGTNPLYAYMGIRYFELGLDFFMRRGIQIVFMFDEFEEMLRQMPVKFFQTLRGIRDAHKRQLSYLTFTRSPLPMLIEQYAIPPLDVEPFAELFTDNVYYVGPYGDADARRMVDELMRRNDVSYQDATINFLLDATGRYAGLLRAGFRSVENYDGQVGNPDAGEQLLAQLASKPAVRAECKTIWTSLSRSEQIVLKAVAHLAPYQVSAESELAVTNLVQKRLLYVDRAQQRLEIYPPLLRAFIFRNLEID
jgi:hypothetical protein